MALRAPSSRRHAVDDDDSPHPQDLDEEIDETEDDLIANYRFLTERCGVLRQSPTTSAISAIQQQQEKKKQHNQSSFVRQYSSISETSRHQHQIKTKANKTRESDFSFSLASPRHCCILPNDLNNNTPSFSAAGSRIPPTIYYNDNGDDALVDGRSFSLVRLFARMKARLKHDRRYRSQANHELLYEEDPQEWYELTKNVRAVLTKALLPDGGYDAMAARAKARHSRQGSCKKARDYGAVFSADVDDENKITVTIDDELNAEDDPELDELVWQKFLSCARGFKYRRCGVCKAIDRQQFQGQLVFFYGVANNILIDENLKASGLG